MFLEAALVVGVAGVIVYALFMALTRPQEQSRPVYAGEWQVAHYEADGATRVVLQKVATGGATVLDEHLVTAVRVDDPDYEHKFLDAMRTARERRALFESEED